MIKGLHNPINCRWEYCSVRTSTSGTLSISQSIAESEEDMTSQVDEMLPLPVPETGHSSSGATPRLHAESGSNAMQGKQAYKLLELCSAITFQ